MKEPVSIARKLRQSQTDAEKKLWSKLRNRQLQNLKFRRQHPIPPYTIDFFCEEEDLVIEIDGGQHNQEVDKQRTAFLEEQGLIVLRFWNNEVLENTEGVLEKILMTVNTPSPTSLHSAPSPHGRGIGKRICLARIAGAHGVKGLVKLLPYGEDPSILEATNAVYLGSDTEKTIKITLKNAVGSHILAEIEHVNNREEALALKGTELFINKAALPALDDENTYYYDDLKGLKAIDNEGKTIGTIIAVDNFGAGDLLEIQPTDGSNQFYLPFKKENTGQVDLEKQTIIVHNTEDYRM